MPMSCAAAAWVSFRWRMVRSIRTTSPALIRCSPASARPRSANTLPVLASCSRAFLFGILHLTSQLFEPLPDEFHLRPRRRDPGLGLLLEGVDHVNRFSDRNRIDRAVGSANVMGRQTAHWAYVCPQDGTEWQERIAVHRTRRPQSPRPCCSSDWQHQFYLQLAP